MDAIENEVKEIKQKRKQKEARKIPRYESESIDEEEFQDCKYMSLSEGVVSGGLISFDLRAATTTGLLAAVEQPFTLKHLT